MQYRYRVHGPHNTPLRVTVEHDGEMLDVVTNGFEMELVPFDPLLSTVKMRFKGAQADEARIMFQADVVVSLTLTVDE